MTETRPHDERDLLAAEYVLGLLAGDDLRRARLLAVEDPLFAAQIADWELRLAPLVDEIDPVAPAPELRARIMAATADAPAQGENVVVLRRKVGRWRAAATAMTALAASLAFFLLQPAPAPPAPVGPPAATAPMLVASLSSSDGPASLTAAYDVRHSSLTLVPGRVAAGSGHDHELWIIPAGGTPFSLGVVRLDATRRMVVPAAMIGHFRDRATLAVSVEPVGGSLTGQPTGPVIAAGQLLSV